MFIYFFSSFFSSLSLLLLDFSHFVTEEVRVRQGRRKKGSEDIRKFKWHMKIKNG